MARDDVLPTTDSRYPAAVERFCREHNFDDTFNKFCAVSVHVQIQLPGQSEDQFAH